MTAPVPHPSPNHGPRRGGAVPDMVVLHYTAMASARAALARLCDPVAEVSAHYLIGRDGTCWQLVAEEDRAWHAGAGAWGRVTDVNSRSIGIELDNDGQSPFSAPLMDRLERLLAAIMARHGVPPERIIAHQDMAPNRKADPGPRFDWRRLACTGLSVWPTAGTGEPLGAVGRSGAGASTAPGDRAGTEDRAGRTGWSGAGGLASSASSAGSGSPESAPVAAPVAAALRRTTRSTPGAVRGSEPVSEPVSDQVPGPDREAAGRTGGTDTGEATRPASPADNGRVPNTPTGPPSALPHRPAPRLPPAPDTAGLEADLAAFGYTAPVPLAARLAAFRARFRPGVCGPPDAVDAAFAADLARRFPVDRGFRGA